MREAELCDFPRTDAGNAEFFAKVNADDLRFDHKRERWLVWHEHWWIEDTKGLVNQRAKSLARMRAQLALEIEDEDERKAELKWAFRSEFKGRLDAMLKLAEYEYPLAESGEGWDSNPMLFAVANGVIDLQTGKLRKGEPSDRITVHSNISYEPIANCPLWEQFLSDIFNGDAELIAYVQRAVGYCLTGATTEQCFFLCYGTGANGKSTFLEILRRVVGAYGFNLPFSAFELQGRSSIPNDMAAIAGRRLVTSLETNESVQLNEARIKALTGGDQVTARFLYCELFEFLPAAKFWLACNHQPKVADDSPGFWRRTRLIPFTQSFVGKEDRELLAKLTAEAPGILNWVLNGCLRWQNEGLGLPTVVKEVTDAYRQDSDQLGEFIGDECILVPEKRVAASELWARYLEWASDCGERERLDRRAFSRRLETKGFKKVRLGHKRVWTWLGIDVRNGSSACVPNHPLSPLLSPEVRADADVKNPIVTQ
jgi:putative DNA primase/helicase